MKKTLFEMKSADVNVEITAAFDGAELIIEGIDSGSKVTEWFGDEEYEYVMVLPEDCVAELRHVLNLNPFARRDLLETLAARFQGESCFADIKSFLEKQYINYKIYNWAS